MVWFGARETRLKSHPSTSGCKRFCREGTYGNLSGTQPMPGRCRSSAWVFHWAYGRSLWMAINTGKNLEAQDEMKKTEDNPWRFLWKLSVCWFVFVKTFVSTDSVSSFWQILPPTIGLTASRRVSVALLMRKNLQWNKWKATSPIPKMNFGDQYRRRRFFNVFFQWSVDRIPWKVKGCTRIAEAYIYRRVLLWLDGMWRVMLISTLTQFLWESKEIRRNGCIYCVRKRTCWKMFAHIPFQWFSSVRETTSGRCFWDDPKID